MAIEALVLELAIQSIKIKDIKSLWLIAGLLALDYIDDLFMFLPAICPTLSIS